MIQHFPLTPLHDHFILLQSGCYVVKGFNRTVYGYTLALLQCCKDAGRCFTQTLCEVVQKCTFAGRNEQIIEQLHFFLFRLRTLTFRTTMAGKFKRVKGAPLILHIHNPDVTAVYFSLVSETTKHNTKPQSNLNTYIYM